LLLAVCCFWQFVAFGSLLLLAVCCFWQFVAFGSLWLGSQPQSVSTP
jgi:hypothetical protein